MLKFRNLEVSPGWPKGLLLAVSGLLLGLVVALILVGLLGKSSFQEGNTPGIFWLFVFYKPIITATGLIGAWFTFGLITIWSYISYSVQWKANQLMSIPRSTSSRIVIALAQAFGTIIGIYIVGLFCWLILLLPTLVVAGLVILIALSLMVLALSWLKQNFLVGAILMAGFATLLSAGAFLPAYFTHLHPDDVVVVGKDTYYLADRRILRNPGYAIYRCEGSGPLCQRVFTTEETHTLRSPHLSYDTSSSLFKILEGNEVRFTYQTQQ